MGESELRSDAQGGALCHALFVLAGEKSVGNTVGKTVEAAKALFVIAEVARKNFEKAAERRAAVTIAFCALAGKVKPSAADRKLIERELGK